MFKKILAVVVIVLTALAGIVSQQPNDFRYERAATICAPAAKVFDLVNQTHKWELWSPWVKLDPNAKFTYEVADFGVGAVINWEGNSEIGAGTSTIIESRPNEFIKFKLDFKKPMEATNTAEFSFKPEGDKTLVTWTMYGSNNFVSKAMGLVFDCEKKVEEMFDTGLASLKTLAEAVPAK